MQFGGIKPGIQVQGPITQTRIDMLLMELAQELNNETSLYLDPKSK